MSYGSNTYAWQNGRQLASANIDGKSISYTYNADGIRTSKTVNGIKHTYTLNGSQVVTESWSDYYFVYLYDESGSPIGLQYRTSSMADDVFNTYFFEKNLQGDITAIFKGNGVKIGTYCYDAWGNVKTTVSSGITALEKNIVQSYNPFRYRGYYYDTESGLYYLQSRYYNPQWGRFLNADGYVSTGQGLLSCNMFAYCENNPVMRTDASGLFWAELWENITQNVTQSGEYFAAAAAVSQVDTPAFGIADIVSAVLLVECLKICTATAIYDTVNAIPKDIAIPKIIEREKDTALPPPTTVYIYRYGGTNPGNLTPKEKDRYTGLSFSTIPSPGAAKTTIEALNRTGIVYAVQDSRTHVSVYPVGATMDDWIEAGSSSRWTQAVKSVVTK